MSDEKRIYRGILLVAEETVSRGLYAVRFGALLRGSPEECGRWAELLIVDRTAPSEMRLEFMAAALADTRIVKVERREGRYTVQADVALPVTVAGGLVWTGDDAQDPKLANRPFALEDLSWTAPLAQHLRTVCERLAAQSG